MKNPFTRAQALENARFLEVLGQTGNVRLAAREVRRAHSTMFDRRRADACFAQRWDAAVAAAHARFHLAGGKRPPEAEATSRNRSSRAKSRGAGTESSHTPLDFARDERNGDGLKRRARDGWNPSPGLRTRGGEPVVVRTKSGRLQLRPAHADRLTKAAEQGFLQALSATANVRLSAAAAGASPRAFYRRAQRSRAFAREMRLALKTGYDRLEAALLEAGMEVAHADGAWRRNDLPPIPPMTANQALQLLHLHEKSVRQGWEKPHRRRRRGETFEAFRHRLGEMWAAEQRREAEDAALRRAAHYEETGDWRFAEEAPAPPEPELPPLHLVTGWSRADPDKAPHDPDIALFGGWRIEDMKRKIGKGGRGVGG